MAGEGLHGDVFKAAAEDFHFVAAFGLFKKLRRSGRGFVGGAHEARRVEDAVSHGSLVLMPAAGAGRGAQRGGLGSKFRHGIEVDDDGRNLSEFHGHGFLEAPDKALRGNGLIRGAHGLRLAGDSGEADF